MSKVHAATRLAMHAAAWQRTAAMMSALVVAVAGLAAAYLVKSWLGINLMDGHVPVLHDLLYPLVRG